MATLTIVVSRIDMMLPSTTTRARRLRWGSSPASTPRAPASPGAAPAVDGGSDAGRSGGVFAVSLVVIGILGI